MPSALDARDWAASGGLHGIGDSLYTPFDRCYVLEAGGIALEGPSTELAGDPRVAAIVSGAGDS